MYVIVWSPGGVHGANWIAVGIGFLLDLLSYTSRFTQRMYEQRSVSAQSLPGGSDSRAVVGACPVDVHCTFGRARVSRAMQRSGWTKTSSPSTSSSRRRHAS
jgi:hypothetical protein